MIRCSECERLEPLTIKHKRFWFCKEYCSLNGCGNLWKQMPKRHPHWCPKRKEEKKC